MDKPDLLNSLSHECSELGIELTDDIMKLFSAVFSTMSAENELFRSCNRDMYAALGGEFGEDARARARRVRAERDELQVEAELIRQEHKDGDGSHRLCMALYGKEETRKMLGGSEAPLLHDAADRILELEKRLEALE